MAQDETASNCANSQSRALVVVSCDKTRPSGTACVSLPDAGFLTQIIASSGNMGHFRRYRRAEPAHAVDSYNAASRLVRSAGK